MSFLDELRRRNVFRVGIAYAVATWVLLQITEVITPILGLPDWAPKLIFVVLAVGFVPALIFAWAYELTPEGIKREKDVDRSKSITRRTGRKLDFVIIAVLVLAVSLLLVDRYSGQPAPDSQQMVRKSIDRGFRSYAKFAMHTPMFRPLRDDPRFVAVRDIMVGNINGDREALGLEPIDPVKQLRH